MIRRHLGLSTLLLCLGSLATGLVIAQTEAVGLVVDQVVVNKTERTLRLLSGDTVVRQYDISLGDEPTGHKTREGDEKTPEGDYLLDYRNPNSRYHKSIHISYPNSADKRQAQEGGYSPGGDIFIHGLPNGMGQMATAFTGRDWTDGCIAINNNDHMDDVWELVKNGTPIRIVP